MYKYIYIYCNAYEKIMQYTIIDSEIFLMFMKY